MEAMSVELLLSALWELDGFLTKTRLPIKVKGGWSDVDVVGLNAECLRIGELKAHGPPDKVFAFQDAQSLVGKLEKTGWDNSLANLHLLWEPRPLWLPLPERLDSVEYWICGNFWLPPDEWKLADELFTRRVQVTNELDGRVKKIVGRVVSTRDLLFETIEKARRVIGDRPKRFGNPILDVIRELLRYCDPKPTPGGKRVATEIIENTRKRLTVLLFGDCERTPWQ